MTYPKMIMFDYGHTLAYEPGWDPVRGERALLQYAAVNKYGVTAEQLSEYSQGLSEKIKAARQNGLEIHERQFQRFLYEYNGVELSISLEEAERVFWTAAVPGKIMPDADKMLDYINGKGIRSAVISNIGWSGNALRERLDRLLPRNRFEFVIASSEYMFRKPEKMLFELAARKSGLNAGDIWFCGDNPIADVEGSAGAGMFPVLYDSFIECAYRDKTKETIPECGQLYIRGWDELIAALETLEADAIHGEN